MGNEKQNQTKITKRCKRTRDSGTALRSAIKKMVANESEKIAKALVEKSIEGNMTGVKLLVDLTGAGTPRAKPTKKRRGSTAAQHMSNAKPWPGQPDKGSKSSHPLPSNP